ncbi:hypothetical protein HPB47_014623 [Ixodes persulcatus]|uniref:Uncharacterized protein n=1 Tax=Ixodes persulcatus TaxID=34615 RepID=A0AC60QZ72_IXOPE|nr:hypothetical protein HPB47_014623 [Ixodes persulcatus]
MNAIRVPLIRDGLLQARRRAEKAPKSAAKPLAGLRILDVGCGGGLLSEPLARLGATVTGIDPTPGCIEVARAHADRDPEVRDSVIYEAVEAEELVQRCVKFDAVVASEVVDHVQNYREFVKCCVALTEILALQICDRAHYGSVVELPAFVSKEGAMALGFWLVDFEARGRELVLTSFRFRTALRLCVNDGGSLFFTTINRTLLSYLIVKIAAEYIFRIVPAGLHDWDMFLPPEELEEELETTNGFSLDMLTTAWFILVAIAIPCQAYLDDRVRLERHWTGFSPTKGKVPEGSRITSPQDRRRAEDDTMSPNENIRGHRRDSDWDSRSVTRNGRLERSAQHVKSRDDRQSDPQHRDHRMTEREANVQNRRFSTASTRNEMLAKGSRLHESRRRVTEHAKTNNQIRESRRDNIIDESVNYDDPVNRRQRRSAGSRDDYHFVSAKAVVHKLPKWEQLISARTSDYELQPHPHSVPQKQNFHWINNIITRAADPNSWFQTALAVSMVAWTTWLPNKKISMA